MIYPGRPYTFNSEPLYLKYIDNYGPSRHMTVVFTAFVFMQVFNMINARKIHDEKHVFAGIVDNRMFCGIWMVIFVVQMVLSQFSQDIFQCSRDGLTWFQWLICLVIGIGSIPVDFLLKFVPDQCCPEIGKKRKPAIDSGVLNARKKRTVSLSQGNLGSVHRETPK